MKKLALALAAAGAAVLFAAAAHAQPYPSKPIKFLVPFAAGGPADTMARLTARTLEQGLNQVIVIDNRPGAGGIIGARAAALADPDGYTLMYGNTASLVVGPAVYTNPGYDPVKAFAPIALVAVTFNVLAVNPKFPANTVKELIAYAKKNPGKVNFASPGHGTPPHMVGEMFKQRAAIDIVHIPYKGTAAALTDIMGGQVEMTFENPSVIIPLVQAGKLKALGVTGETRNPTIPDVPTMIEGGRARLHVDVVHGAGRARGNAAGDRQAARRRARPRPRLRRDPFDDGQARRDPDARHAGRLRRLPRARKHEVADGGEDRRDQDRELSEPKLIPRSLAGIGWFGIATLR